MVDGTSLHASIVARHSRVPVTYGGATTSMVVGREIPTSKAPFLMREPGKAYCCYACRIAILLRTYKLNARDPCCLWRRLLRASQ